MLANTAAILAQRNVKITHKIHTDQSGVPPMAKWETAPVKAVKVIIRWIFSLSTLIPDILTCYFPVLILPDLCYTVLYCNYSEGILTRNYEGTEQLHYIYEILEGIDYAKSNS